MSNMATTSTPNNKTPKQKPSKTVILRLKADVLARFPSGSNSSKLPDTPSKQSSDKTSDSAGTPAASTLGAGDDTPDPEAKKKGVKPGVKRTSSAATLDKPKGRPGPKKKPRLADGTIDKDGKATPATGGTSAAHKINPKANTGAINANLRALDRSGKACRKWQRKGFSLKSFTGVTWGVGSWSAPARATSDFSGDTKSDSSSTVDVKPTMESSVVPSESSRAGDVPHPAINGLVSSPAPVSVR